MHTYILHNIYSIYTLFKTEILHSMHCIFHCQIRPAANKLQNYKTDIIENKIAQSIEVLIPPLASLFSRNTHEIFSASEELETLAQRKHRIRGMKVREKGNALKLNRI